MCDPRV